MSKINTLCKIERFSQKEKFLYFITTFASAMMCIFVVFNGILSYHRVNLAEINISIFKYITFLLLCITSLSAFYLFIDDKLKHDLKSIKKSLKNLDTTLLLIYYNKVDLYMKNKSSRDFSIKAILFGNIITLLSFLCTLYFSKYIESMSLIFFGVLVLIFNTFIFMAYIDKSKKTYIKLSNQFNKDLNKENIGINLNKKSKVVFITNTKDLLKYMNNGYSYNKKSVKKLLLSE